MPSRISGACNACRTRKQKCSGDRTGCAQCREAGHECTWPAQKKRGPAKGYIEGLEHRLHDAEQLLLQVLPLVTIEQLASVTSDMSIGGTPDGNRATPPLLNKKTGIEYWEQYPLDTAESIRRWQDDCAHNHRSNSIPGRRTSPQHGIEFNPPHSRMGSKRSFDESQDTKISYTQRSAAQAPQWTSTYEIPKLGMTATAYGVENAQNWQPHQQLQQPQQPLNNFIPEDAQRLFW